MSRSKPEEDAKVTNPALRFYQWSGSTGKFEYYDKEAKKKVEVPLPFNFLPIERCVTLKGFNDDTKTSYWSNEVKDVNKDKFTLQSVTSIGGNKKIKVEVVGLYKDIKPTLDALDISYVESIYIGVKNGKGLDLCNLQVKGAALSPWFTIAKEYNVSEIAVTVKSSIDKKKGSVKYKEPVFTAITKISKEMNDQAIALDIALQEYLKGYFAKNAASTKTAEPEGDAKPVTSDKAPFIKGTPKEAQHSSDTMTEEVADINFGDPDAPEEF